MKISFLSFVISITVVFGTNNKEEYASLKEHYENISKECISLMICIEEFNYKCFFPKKYGDSKYNINSNNIFPVDIINDDIPYKIKKNIEFFSNKNIIKDKKINDNSYKTIKNSSSSYIYSKLKKLNNKLNGKLKKNIVSANDLNLNKDRIKLVIHLSAFASIQESIFNHENKFILAYIFNIINPNFKYNSSDNTLHKTKSIVERLKYIINHIYFHSDNECDKCHKEFLKISESDFNNIQSMGYVFDPAKEKEIIRELGKIITLYNYIYETIKEKENILYNILKSIFSNKRMEKEQKKIVFSLANDKNNHYYKYSSAEGYIILYFIYLAYSLPLNREYYKKRQEEIFGFLKEKLNLISKVRVTNSNMIQLSLRYLVTLNMKYIDDINYSNTYIPLFNKKKDNINYDNIDINQISFNWSRFLLENRDYDKLYNTLCEINNRKIYDTISAEKDCEKAISNILESIRMEKNSPENLFSFIIDKKYNIKYVNSYA